MGEPYEQNNFLQQPYYSRQGNQQPFQQGNQQGNQQPFQQGNQQPFQQGNQQTFQQGNQQTFQQPFQKGNQPPFQQGNQYCYGHQNPQQPRLLQELTTMYKSTEIQNADMFELLKNSNRILNEKIDHLLDKLEKTDKTLEKVIKNHIKDD